MDYRTSLGVVQNFPKSGVTFFDINPILANKDFFCCVVDDFLKKWENKGIEKIVAIESRGFILGSALALKMSLGFVPIRKAGKLPGEVFSSSYTLEYGDDALEIQKNALHNLKTLHCNGEILLRDALDDNVIENLFIFHPDPWFKTRHHKRRVINSNSIKLIKKKLTSEGKLHFSTDVKSLWEASKETILKENFKLIDYNHFWEDDYITHWNKFSDKDNRITYKGTFSLKTSDS